MWRGTDDGSIGVLSICMGFVLLVGLVGYSALHDPQHLSPPDRGPGSVFDWGRYGSGGRNQTLIGKSPTRVDGLGGVSLVQASNSNSYALEGGTEYAWGYGSAGELGDGQFKDSLATPQKVDFPAGTSITALGDAAAAGYAVDSTGAGWSWGENTSGDLCLGPGVTLNQSFPQPVPGLPPVTAVAGAYDHVLWLTVSGQVYACGDDTYGVLGDGATGASSAPVPVQGLPANDPVVAVSAGWGTSAALTQNGQLYMWGDNDYGALGIGKAQSADTASLVPGTFSQVYAGGSQDINDHTIAVTTDGTVEVWGANSYGELGLGYVSAMISEPTVMPLPQGVTSFDVVMAGGPESGAIDSQGNVWMWGSNADGQVGDGKSNGRDVLTPMKVDAGFTLLSGTSSNVVVA